VPLREKEKEKEKENENEAGRTKAWPGRFKIESPKVRERPPSSLLILTVFPNTFGI
jgi:hypothetical protein